MRATLKPAAVIALLMPCLIAAQNPLIVPEDNQDLSAFRLDSEVFGWNKDYSEVAAVCMEMARDPQGAHRGETYLLVYPVQKTLPKHNVICHFITHVALPHNPISLEEAGDYMWTIENSFQQMWPRRPKRHRPPQAMDVTTLWAAMPKDEAQKPANPAIAGQALRAPRDSGSCVPWVGFKMRWGKEVRLQPYAPVDMSARCELLHMKDQRTYWGKNDVAAAMVRFDFATRADNEESARFVVSALWSSGRHVRFDLRTAVAPTPQERKQFNLTVSAFGRARIAPLKGASQGDILHHLTVRAAPGWLPLGRKLAQQLGTNNPLCVADASMNDVIVFSDMAPTTPKEADPPALPAPWQPQVHPSDPVPKAQYLDDFKVK
jgi:hypothetical protein